MMMRTDNIKSSLAMGVICMLLAFTATAQDKVYTTDGKVIEGKVTEVNPTAIKLMRSSLPEGPLYILKAIDVDSIVYANGIKDEMPGVIKKRSLTSNIPQKNTWSFDVLGFAFFSVSQSFEHRFDNGFMALRIPIYIGFTGGGIAGVGRFKPGYGVFYYNDQVSQNGHYYDGRGFSIASGFNLKFYLLKRRVVRPFIGPEFTIGVTRENGYSSGYYTNTLSNANRNGTVAALVKFGLMFNPKDKFNMCIDGGAGVGDSFGGLSPYGLAGLWHIGLAFGTNF